MTQATHGEAELRGVRLVYPDQRLTVNQVAEHLGAMHDLWDLCCKLDRETAPAAGEPRDRASTEEALLAEARPLREMADRLEAALDDRLRREGAPMSTSDATLIMAAGRGDMSMPSSLGDAVALARRLQRVLSDGLVRPLARQSDLSWRLALALHLAQAVPFAEELRDRLAARDQMTAERDYTAHLAMLLQRTVDKLRLEGGTAALARTQPLAVHYLNAVPRLDIIAVVSAGDEVTAHSMYLLAKVMRDPMNAHRWLPGWIDRIMPLRQATGHGLSPRESLDQFSRSARDLVPRLLGPPTDVVVAGLGSVPPDLV